MVLGGTFLLEVLALPPRTKKIKVLGTKADSRKLKENDVFLDKARRWV